jgi:hypothetical protein
MWMDTIPKFYKIKALPNLLYIYMKYGLMTQIKWIGTLEMKLLRTLGG